MSLKNKNDLLPKDSTEGKIIRHMVYEQEQTSSVVWVQKEREKNLETQRSMEIKTKLERLD